MGALAVIPRKITKGEELLVIKKSEYENIKKQLNETVDALHKISAGEREFRSGKIASIRSLVQLEKRRR